MKIITKPKVEIAPELLKQFQEMTAEEGQVIIHCMSGGSLLFDSYLRIWKSTFLLDQHSNHASELVHVENISMAPEWMLVPAGSFAHYSLFFSGLPKDCTVFDLEEMIAQPGGFTAKNITRNKSDVYFIKL